MIPTTANPDGTNLATGGYVVPGNVGAAFLWCATARDKIAIGGDGTASSVRESDVCYMRGLKEDLYLTSSTGSSWRWRRICFTARGFENTAVITSRTSLETSNGWVRLLASVKNTTNDVNIQTYLFQGAAGIDWIDPFIARPDNNRVSIKYDRTRILRSGNANGVFLHSKQWMPMNSNLVYNTDEQGESENNGVNSFYSTVGRKGMGDYYVYDIFDNLEALSTNQLIFRPEATLYWHEK